MKTISHCAGALLLLSTLNPQSSALFAQGSLTLPGAPAPAADTPAPLESRVPISFAPFNISDSGSYYLTTNLNVAAGDVIIISADGVTLDLNGFTIASTEAGPAGTGILLSGTRSDIHIRNGHIKGGVSNNAGHYSGSGFLSGINFSGEPPSNVRVSGVSVSGCLGMGIFLAQGESTVVESCTVRTVGYAGISANTVARCAAKECGANAISAITASDCVGISSSTGIFDGVRALTANNCAGLSDYGNGLSAGTANNCYGGSSSGIGISVDDGGMLTGCKAENSSLGIRGGNGCTIKDCTASQNAGHGISAGISAGDGSTIQNCTVRSNSGDGIRVTNDCQVVGNLCTKNGHGATDTGSIHVLGNNNRVDGNHCVGNLAAGGNGIKVDAGRNLIVRNSSRDHKPRNYDIVAGDRSGPNSYGQILSTPGNNFNNSNPSANFAF
jgi:parallel beta-helix repeat protein